MESKSIQVINLEKEQERKNSEIEIPCEESKAEVKAESKKKTEEASIEMLIDPPVNKILVENFPDVSLFINNHDCLACILKDGVIYKLFC